MSPGRRAALCFGAPTLAILALTVLPVVLGRETLVLRDVLEAHLMLKAHPAEALREGVLPVLDPHRSGGQPLLGNPNTLPFYPGNLLYAAAPTLWALNAHFWLHWLLAPLAACWMGRSWGLSRPAAWAAGACYAASGYFFSQLNLYNLVAGAALVPALVAAALRAAEGRRWALPAAGGLWALVLLSGDPATALLGGALAAAAAAVHRPAEVSRARAAGALALAALLGTLVALPQIVELLRVLPSTFRGHWGYAEFRFSLGAWRPVHALEWLVPLPFGRYDLREAGGFWGRPLFDGFLPIFLSLHPGVLALGLVAASGLPRRRAAWWAWSAVGVGLFLAAGGTHPAGRWLLELPGAQALRFPVKAWLLVAVGAALLCGIGWERTFGRLGSPSPGGSLRRLAWPLAAIGLLLAAAGCFVVLAPGRFEALVLGHAREGFTPALAAVERSRWIATLVALGGLLAGLALALALARRRAVAGAALLLALHAAGQVFFLRTLVLTDDADLYRTPPAPLAAIPPGARVAHAGYLDLFGPSPGRPAPDNRSLWVVRQDYFSLIPGAGILHGGLRYELARSPEGLESFLARIAYEAVHAGPTDADRVRGLGRWGVEYLITERPLRGVSEDLARRVGTWPGPTVSVHVYRLPGAAPEVLFAESELRAPHLNAAWDLFRSPGFDPGRHAVLPGAQSAPVPAPPAGGPPSPGRVRVLARGPESLEVETSSPVPGVLVVQRSLLPVWRAAVDGAPAALEPANLYRIGVRVPAGRHRVRLWVDRRPLGWSLAGSALGLAGLGLLGLLGLPGSGASSGASSGGSRRRRDRAPAADTISRS